jgi:hypothetical protein
MAAGARHEDERLFCLNQTGLGETLEYPRCSLVPYREIFGLQAGVTQSIIIPNAAL